MFKIFKSTKGFTLVELLVVVTIISILASLSVASVNIARQRARDAKRRADISQVQLALYFYFDDNMQFPFTNEEMLPENTTVENWATILAPALSGANPGDKVYMVRAPVDPLNIYPNVYKYVSNGKEFVITYYLEEGEPVEIHGY